MKKNLRKFKNLGLLLILMVTVSAVNAANRFSVATGNWNATTTWSATSGGAPGASVPVAGDVVTIEGGFTVTVTANAACATLNVNTGTLIIGAFNFDVSATTTINGTITSNSTTGAKNFDNMVINAGGLFNSTANENYGMTGSLQVNGTGSINSGTGTWSFTGSSTLSGSATTVSITTAAFSTSYTNSGTFSFTNLDISGAGTVNLTNNGTISVATALTGTDNFVQGATGVFNFAGGNIAGNLNATTSGNTVRYNGTTQTIDNVTYSNLILSNSGTKTPANDFTVNDALTIDAGVTLDVAGNNISLSSASINIDGILDFSDTAGFIDNSTGTSVVNMGVAGLIRTADVSGLGPVANASFQNNGTTFTTTSISTNGTVEYDRNVTSGQTVTDRDYNNLIISGNTQLKTWTLGAARTVNGDLTISANAPFTLTGAQTLSVKGDWTKNSTGALTFGATTVVNFNGTAAQAITGSQTTAFSNITFNNTFAGVAITVSRLATISGLATFTDGIVSTDATNYLSFLDNATVGGAGLSQATDASFVVGPVRKTGDDAFVFPVGALVTATGGGYMPLTITAPDNVADALSCEYVRGNATAIQTNGFTAPILNVSKCDYWNLNETNDAGSATSIGVTLSWDDGSPCNNKPFITNVSALTVAHFNSGTSKWEQAGTGGPAPSGTPTTGSVTRTGVSVFSPFSLGNTLNGANPLPVTFFDVKAFEKNSGVQVEWVNLTEKDLANYSVERSVNGRDFTAITTIAARSNQNDAQSYNNFDASPFAGTSFYRIKAVEVDGKISYSKLLKVEIGKTQKGIALYPNPVTGSDLTIGFTAVKGQYTLGVVNSVGQKVFTQTLSHQGGTVSQSISLPASVKPGMYTMLLTGDNYRETKIFVIQ